MGNLRTPWLVDLTTIHLNAMPLVGARETIIGIWTHGQLPALMIFIFSRLLATDAGISLTLLAKLRVQRVIMSSFVHDRGWFVRHQRSPPFTRHHRAHRHPHSTLAWHEWVPRIARQDQRDLWRKLPTQQGTAPGWDGSPLEVADSGLAVMQSTGCAAKPQHARRNCLRIGSVIRPACIL